MRPLDINIIIIAKYSIESAEKGGYSVTELFLCLSVVSERENECLHRDTVTSLITALK